MGALVSWSCILARGGNVETGSLDVLASNPGLAGGWHDAHLAMGAGDTQKPLQSQVTSPTDPAGLCWLVLAVK